jgi:hypothetical protein
MEPESSNRDLQALAAMAALGLLSRQEDECFGRIAALCPSLEDEARSLRETAALLALATPAVEPAPGLKDRLMGRIRPPGKRNRGLHEALPGIHILYSGEGVFKKTPFEGVSYQTLHVDRRTDTATTLLKLEPGSEYPKHRHSSEELCWVISGDVRINELQLHGGDFERAAPDTVHEPIRSDTGCLLLIISSLHDVLLV